MRIFKFRPREFKTNCQNYIVKTNIITYYRILLISLLELGKLNIKYKQKHVEEKLWNTKKL